MNPIQEFCKERKVNKIIEEAFTTYVKVSYSTSLMVKQGDTLSSMIKNMTRENVNDFWGRFVLDFKDSLS